MGIRTCYLQHSSCELYLKGAKIKSFDIETEKDFLNKTDCVYTCTRTINLNRIVAFQAHVDRLYNGAKSMKIILDRKFIENAVFDLICFQIKNSPTNKSDVKITILVDELKIYVFQSPLNKVKHPTNVCIVKTTDRSDPTVKSTNWITERNKIKARVSGEYEEILMMNGDQQIIEGLSSNVGGISKDGTCLIVTPNDKILMGTIMSIAIRAAQSLKLEIKEQSMRLGDISSYRGMFICSTSRLLLPIQKIFLLDEEVSKEIEIEQAFIQENDQIEKLKKLMIHMIEQESTLIY